MRNKRIKGIPWWEHNQYERSPEEWKRFEKRCKKLTRIPRSIILAFYGEKPDWTEIFDEEGELYEEQVD